MEQLHISHVVGIVLTPLDSLQAHSGKSKSEKGTLMPSRMKISTVRVLVMMAVLAVWSATGSATPVANLGGITVTTSAQETIVFDFVKYADVTDVVSSGIHTIT